MDLQNMVDVTHFGRLCDYLQDDNDPSTTALIEVFDERLDLVEVAERFVDDSKESTFQVTTWRKTGAIRVNPSIPRNMAVECIKLVPFFIFKNLKRKYE